MVTDRWYEPQLHLTRVSLVVVWLSYLQTPQAHLHCHRRPCCPGHRCSQDCLWDSPVLRAGTRPSERIASNDFHQPPGVSDRPTVSGIFIGTLLRTDFLNCFVQHFVGSFGCFWGHRQVPSSKCQCEINILQCSGITTETLPLCSKTDPSSTISHLSDSHHRSSTIDLSTLNDSRLSWSTQKGTEFSFLDHTLCHPPPVNLKWVNFHRSRCTDGVLGGLNRFDFSNKFWPAIALGRTQQKMFPHAALAHSSDDTTNFQRVADRFTALGFVDHDLSLEGGVGIEEVMACARSLPASRLRSFCQSARTCWMTLARPRILHFLCWSGQLSAPCPCKTESTRDRSRLQRSSAQHLSSPQVSDPTQSQWLRHQVVLPRLWWPLERVFELKDESKLRCIHEDLKKVNLIFSEETSRTMSNGQHENLGIKTDEATTQCYSCSEHVPEGLRFCMCGACLQPDQGTIDKFQERFRTLIVPYNVDKINDPRVKRHGEKHGEKDHFKAKDAMRGAKKRTENLSVLVRLQKDGTGIPMTKKTSGRKHFAVIWTFLSRYTSRNKLLKLKGTDMRAQFIWNAETQTDSWVRRENEMIITRQREHWRLFAKNKAKLSVTSRNKEEWGRKHIFRPALNNIWSGSTSIGKNTSRIHLWFPLHHQVLQHRWAQIGGTTFDGKTLNGTITIGMDRNGKNRNGD